MALLRYVANWVWAVLLVLALAAVVGVVGTGFFWGVKVVVCE